MPALAVEETEFAARGIHFGRARLLQPFINEAVLRATFGGEVDFVAANSCTRKMADFIR